MSDPDLGGRRAAEGQVVGRLGWLWALASSKLFVKRPVPLVRLRHMGCSISLRNREHTVAEKGLEWRSVSFDGWDSQIPA